MKRLLSLALGALLSLPIVADVTGTTAPLGGGSPPLPPGSVLCTPSTNTGAQVAVGCTQIPATALPTQPPGTVVCNGSLTATTNPSQCYAPFWYHAGNALTYSSFSAASSSTSITLFTLPAGGVIHAVKIQHSTAFAGTSITAYTISVGLSGNAAKYAAPFSVFSTPTGTNLQLSSGVLYEENDSATTAVTVTATSTGANLSAATAGVVDIWVLVSLGI